MGKEGRRRGGGKEGEREGRREEEEGEEGRGGQRFLVFSCVFPLLSGLPDDCGIITREPLSGYSPGRAPGLYLTIGMVSVIAVLNQIQGFPIGPTSLLAEGL